MLPQGRKNDERSGKQTAELKTARQQTDRAFNALRLMLNAQAITATDNYRYTALIQQVNETIKYYRQISDDRRRSNRRVAVRSEIVGNHTYATVAGWTWQRLVDDGKAALEVTPSSESSAVASASSSSVASASSSASSESPASLIVSTDKKAIKAGGLCVALDGTPVTPTDEIDSTREYELIAISA